MKSSSVEKPTRSLDELTREASMLITRTRNLVRGGERIVTEALEQFHPYTVPPLRRHRR